MPCWTVSSPDLLGLGPVVEIWLGPTAKDEAVMRAAGQSVPAPLAVTALVDTGSSHTVIQQNLPIQLGALPLGLSLFHTPSATNVICLEYAIQLFFPQNVVFETTVVEMPLQGQPIQCLIGRDVLAHAVLVYLGESNLFSLSF